MEPNLSPNELLLWSLIDKNEDNLQQALTCYADANLLSPNGTCPLHAAAFRGSAALIKLLLENEAIVDQTDDYGFTPLMVASLNGKTDAVKVLLSKGADSNLQRLTTGETALHLAMDSGSQEVVNALLDGDANVNAQTADNKFTPLHFAAEFDARDLASVLLEDPLCEPATIDSVGRTAAVVAQGNGYHLLADHLHMQTEARKKADQKLLSAVMKLDDEAARSALEAGANPNLSSRRGSGLLHLAALRGSVPLVKIFLKHRLVVDQTDFMGFTPLMLAALNGRTDVVKVLLEYNADPNLKRWNGQTALHLAMKGRSLGVVDALICQGANINAQTTIDKSTPLHYAAQFDVQLMKEILGKYPNTLKTNSKGLTAVQLAEELGREPRLQPDIPDGSMEKVPVITCEELVCPSEDVYKVISVPRGKVLILNYDQFEEARFRSGAVWDGKKLGNLFTEMGYRVIIERNKTLEETRNILDSFRKNDEMALVDCAVVCVLSHGKAKGTFITSDDKEMTVEEVYEFFTDTRCPNLRGKPKLFIFNFCRGINIEAGCSLDNMHDYDGQQQNEPQRTVEVLKERISMFGSVEGITALRDEWTGTYFVKAVRKIFAQYAHIDDVAKLAQRVNKYMTEDLWATTTSIEGTATKKLYLNPTLC